ncbi:MAG: ATP-binding protein [Bdellovibrionaceae bacterium]|nr:ATP-binding protein [Pseudobdellovibrionaceae bacterium]
MNQQNALCEQLPYWEFEAEPLNHMILWDGSVSAGLELLPLDVECMAASGVNNLTESLRAFVNSLPEGVIAQFIVKVETDFETIIKNHKSLLRTSNEFLKQTDSIRVGKLKEQMENQEVFRPRIYLFFRVLNQVKSKGFFSLKKFSSEFEKGYEDRLQTLIQTIESSKSTLSCVGFYSEVLSKDSLVQLIYKHLNPKRSQDITPPKLKLVNEDLDVEIESPRSQLVFSDLILDQSDFILDQMRTRVLSLKTNPEVTFASMINGLLSFSFKYELIFSFNIPEQSKEMKSLEQTRRTAHSLTANNGGRVSDLEGESRLSQTTDLIKELIETGQRIFEAELLIILREENTPAGNKILNLNTKEVLSKFKTLSGAEGIHETVSSWKVFSSTMPGAPVNLVRKKKMKTNNLVDFLPLYGASIGDELPLVLTHTRHGSMYSVNPYDPKLTNYNMLVTGSSGSGKSFVNNFLMLQQIARGTKVFIIDIGGSYKKLCELLGGQYFEINLSDNYSINPFELKDPRILPSGEKIKSLVSIIEQMVVDAGEKLSRFDRVQIEEALTKVFEDVRHEKNPRSPLISDFARFCAKSKEEGLQKISKLLFPWIGNSPYGKLLDRNGKINADSPVVAFDLKGLSQYPDLQSVMILILTNFILDQIENDRSTPKRVLLDESWELLKSPAASSFMEYAARTFRKTGSGISFITQGVEEIVQSPIGSAILNNTAMKLIMLQKGDTKVLAQSLKLNSQEVRLIQSLEQRKGVFSEGFLMEGDARQVLRIFPSPLEYWISTSDARDNQFLEKLKADERLTLTEAVFRAAEIAPFGVAGLKQKAAA